MYAYCRHRQFANLCRYLSVSFFIHQSLNPPFAEWHTFNQTLSRNFFGQTFSFHFFTQVQIITIFGQHTLSPPQCYSLIRHTGRPSFSDCCNFSPQTIHVYRDELVAFKNLSSMTTSRVATKSDTINAEGKLSGVESTIHTPTRVW